MNILVDRAGCARLADFGLLTLMSDASYQLSSSSDVQGGTCRWMSPELIDPEKFGLERGRSTKSSDCYALGMVIYETISGHPPFHEDKSTTALMKVLRGEHPPRDPGFADELWDMLKLCWEPQPSNRPKIGDVLQFLERVIELSKPPSPSVDEMTTAEGETASTGDETTTIEGEATSIRDETMTAEESLESADHAPGKSLTSPTARLHDYCL